MVNSNLITFLAEGKLTYTDGGAFAEYTWLIVVLPFIAALLITFFGKYLPHEQHLKRISLGDIFLDTYPCSAHTTASDSIKVGVPIITLKGRCFASRVCSSILKQVKMEELVTKSLKEFKDKAIYLGKNEQKLINIKDQIKKNSLNSSLFKPEEFTKNLEKIYMSLI